jgi:predicted RecA/RadA family phage recombinase
MKNFVQKGDNLTFVESALTHPTHTDGLVDGGDPVLVGRIAGVAQSDAASATDNIVVVTKGVFTLSVVSSGNGLSVGETVYANHSSLVLSEDLTGTPFGVALDVVAGGATTTIPIKLFGITPGAAGYFS